MKYLVKKNDKTNLMFTGCFLRHYKMGSNPRHIIKARRRTQRSVTFLVRGGHHVGYCIDAHFG